MADFKELQSTKQIKSGFVMAYITIFINMIAGFVFTPWMVDIIGQEDYGLYTLSASLISLFIMDFGLSAVVTRFLAKYIAEDDHDNIRNLVGMVSKLFLVIDILICIILFAIYFFISTIYQELTIIEIDKLKVIYIISAASSVISFPFSILNGILTSFERFTLQKACDLFNRIFNVVLLFITLSMGYGLFILVTINAFSNLITIILKLSLIKINIPIKFNFKYKSKKMLYEIMSFSLWSTVILISQRFIFNIAPTILGINSGSASIAIFGIASTMEGYIYTFSSAINGLFLPKVSRIVAKKEENNEILNLMIKVGRIQFVIIGLISVGFISFGKEFILLWMGKDFSKAYLCTVILIIPCLLELPQRIGEITMVAVNKVKLQAFVYMGMALINIVLSFILSRYFAELGVCIAICTAYLFRVVAMDIIYYRTLKINVFQFFKECFIKMSFPYILTLIIGLYLNHLLTGNGWIGFLMKVFAISFIYILFMWLFALNKFEKDLFTSMARKVRRKFS